ncbi:energy transducer TonB [Sulfurimonas sp.]|uniref:energy transducer TonB n=1 Tax=Sulfurimonas sp. TaxID=2022749 RepID=UPI0025DB99C5|nr:energy transducer TonB [Sulfurimonas sp.]MBW6488394.1 energy transducer TonB [Sulfurimonas sp.]
MVKYGNSLLISLFVHAVIMLMFFIVYKSYFDIKKTEEEMHCLKLCNIKLSKETAEKKETQKAKTVVQEKQIEPKKVKKAQMPKEIAEKKIEITDKVADIKPSLVDQTEDNILADAEPKAEEREKSSVEPEVAQSALKEQKADDAALTQKVVQEEYIEINMQKIAQLLEENLYYPMSARKRNITGLVKVSFTLGIDAKVNNVKILDSQSDILSRAAIKTIQDLSTKFPKPTKELTLSVPINYNLN